MTTFNTFPVIFQIHDPILHPLIVLSVIVDVLEHFIFFSHSEGFIVWTRTRIGLEKIPIVGVWNKIEHIFLEIYVNNHWRLFLYINLKFLNLVFSES